jgi:hypothetical protein
MSFDRLIKGYLSTNNTLIRTVASSAAVGLSLGLALPSVGCGGMEPTDEQYQEAIGGKADTLERACNKNSDCFAGSYCAGAVGSCPEGAYCILPPSQGTCLSNALCHSDEDCDVGQRCKMDRFPSVGKCPEGAFCILPPTPTKGVCENECDASMDCATGESCIRTNKCPEGAFCIMPPTPPKGLCELMIYAIMPPR